MASSTQLQRKAEHARERLAERLEELRHQVSPAAVVGDFFGVEVDTLHNDVVPVLARTARKNPMACLLIAAGVGWLIYSETRGGLTRPPSTRRRANGNRKAGNGRRRKSR